MQLAETKEEMLRIDRVVLSSAKQKLLRPSDLKAVKVRMAQFLELDAKRLELEEGMRAVALSAVGAKEASAKLHKAKLQLADKLAKVAAQAKAKGVDQAEMSGAAQAAAHQRRKTMVGVRGTPPHLR